ncbi:thioredoxin family protein [Halovulum sp. GXIMD14793]
MRFIPFLTALILAAGSVFAADLGDDGLHKAEWMQDTFKDLREDLEEANAAGKRLAVIIEQRGCIYCDKMHEGVFPNEAIDTLLNEKFFVVQINMFGDVEVTDFDGETLTEKALVRKWGVLFTPAMLFFPEEVPEDMSAGRAAVTKMPGAFGKETTRNMLTWVLEKGYEGDESFQKYHARNLTVGQD